jgi:hypothetical protein
MAKEAAMKSILYGLLIVGVAAALAGCSGATPSVPSAPSISQPGTQMDEIDAKKKVIEILKSAKVTVKVQSCISGSGSATFAAKGKAKGKYRGKLTVSGAWNFVNVSGVSFWTFGETFKIKGHHPVTGTIEGTGSTTIATCKTFGPFKHGKELTYHLGTWSGAPIMNVIKQGAALLEKLPK